MTAVPVGMVSMRDLFGAGLCVIGFFLATYLSGEPKTADFRLSLPLP